MTKKQLKDLEQEQASYYEDIKNARGKNKLFTIQHDIINNDNITPTTKKLFSFYIEAKYKELTSLYKDKVKGDKIEDATTTEPNATI